LQNLNEARINVRGSIVNAVKLTKSYYYKNRYGYGEGSSFKSKYALGKLKHIVNKTFSTN